MKPDIGLITTIAVALLTFFTKIVPEFKNFSLVKKKRRLLNLKNELKDSLIQNNEIKSIIQEEYEVFSFYNMTQIFTNYNSINSYIKFYRKFEQNYTWNDIKEIKSFLKFDHENNLRIEVHNFQLLPARIFYRGGMILFILTLTALLFINLFEYGKAVKINENITLYGYLNITLPIIIVTAYFFIFSNYKPIKAEAMRKYLIRKK